MTIPVDDNAVKNTDNTINTEPVFISEHPDEEDGNFEFLCCGGGGYVCGGACHGSASSEDDGKQWQTDE